MTKAHNIASFVLRFTQELWQDANGEPHVRWRGHIRHVQGQNEGRFTDFAEAVAFMQHHLTELTAETLSDGSNGADQEERVFRESFKLWEQFASSYTDLMSKAIEQSIKQSEVFKEQVDEVKTQALKPWFFYGQSNQKQTEILDALEDLQAQIQTLTERVSDLDAAIKQKNDE